MADYRRMEWQYYANVAAEITQALCIFLGMAEARAAIIYHFPWWDDVAFPVTMLVWWCARFIDSHTRMYRF